MDILLKITFFQPATKRGSADSQVGRGRERVRCREKRDGTMVVV